jgi:hypothetical protein
MVGMAAPFVADPATGVCIRTRLKGLTDQDEAVLGQVCGRGPGLHRQQDPRKTRPPPPVPADHLRPTAKLRARLISMATEHAISVIAVDPAYTY